MLSDDDVDALVHARHGDPFAVLGLHADVHGALWLRAMLPGAAAVAVLDAASGRTLSALALRHPEGLWEARIPRRKNRFAYRPQVQWPGGSEQTCADAFSFGPLIPDEDLHDFGEGSHLRPVPRHGFRLGVPDAAGSPQAWREALNTDSMYYGGSDLGNRAGALAVADEPSRGRGRSIRLTLPPLATVFLVPA